MFSTKAKVQVSEIIAVLIFTNSYAWLIPTLYIYHTFRSFNFREWHSTREKYGNYQLYGIRQSVLTYCSVQ